MPSFDVVSETDLQEVQNAVDSSSREITTRYDFKGSKSSLEREGDEIKIMADDELKLKNIIDILKANLTRRKIDVKCLDLQTPEKASGNMIRQNIKVKQGIEQEIAKKINKRIKDSKSKVQSSIQGDKLRVNGKKRDDLQDAMSLIREMDLDIPINFNNFRD